MLQLANGSLKLSDTAYYLSVALHCPTFPTVNKGNFKNAPMGSCYCTFCLVLSKSKAANIFSTAVEY